MNRPTRQELERSQVDRAPLAALDDALQRCRTEDVRYGIGISAAFSFLRGRATEKWPFEQFRKALEDFNPDDLQAEAR